MAPMISSTTNYHWVKSLSARTHGGGALTLTLRGDRDASSCQYNESDITIFTDDVELTERLIAAINGAAKPVETDQSEAA